jgi:hypothetical protein
MPNRPKVIDLNPLNDADVQRRDVVEFFTAKVLLSTNTGLNRKLLSDPAFQGALGRKLDTYPEVYPFLEQFFSILPHGNGVVQKEVLGQLEAVHNLPDDARLARLAIYRVMQAKNPALEIPTSDPILDASLAAAAQAPAQSATRAPGPVPVEPLQQYRPHPVRPAFAAVNPRRIDTPREAPRVQPPLPEPAAALPQRTGPSMLSTIGAGAFDFFHSVGSSMGAISVLGGAGMVAAAYATNSFSNYLTQTQLIQGGVDFLFGAALAKGAATVVKNPSMSNLVKTAVVGAGLWFALPPFWNGVGTFIGDNPGDRWFTAPQRLKDWMSHSHSQFVHTGPITTSGAYMLSHGTEHTFADRQFQHHSADALLSDTPYCFAAPVRQDAPRNDFVVRVVPVPADAAAAAAAPDQAQWKLNVNTDYIPLPDNHGCDAIHWPAVTAARPGSQIVDPGHINYITPTRGRAAAPFTPV